MTDEPHGADTLTDEEIFQRHADAVAEANREQALDAGPIEIHPTPVQRGRWEAAAKKRGQALEEFLVSAMDAAVEYTEYAQAMRARKRGQPDA